MNNSHGCMLCERGAVGWPGTGWRRAGLSLSGWLLGCWVSLAPVNAVDWPHFRGPHFNGSSSAVGLPERFSQTENVRWSLPLSGPSAATPIVVGDRIFLASTDLGQQQLLAICVDRRTGKLLWQDVVAESIRRDTRSTYAAPSPVSDGERVIFFFGNGMLISYDLEGQREWEVDLGPFAFLWTFSSSPLLHDGRLIMQVLQRDVPVGPRGGGRRGAGGRRERLSRGVLDADTSRPAAEGSSRDRADARTDEQPEETADGIPSYLLALDPATGELLWRQPRDTAAVGESREAFSSPIPVSTPDGEQLLVAGGDYFTGHDPATGKELWRWGTWNPERISHWRLVPSPVAGAGVILLCAPKREPVFALELAMTGNLPMEAARWNSSQNRELSSDVPTPAFYDGDFFVLSDVRGLISRVDPATGHVKWSVRTPGRAKYEASPTVADGKVFIVNFDGQVSLLRADDGHLIATIDMEPELETDEVVRSSIVALDGELLIRTNTRLWSIGE